jgi:colanic acid biosynthesis glycosyl transferase WcaI
MKRTFLFINQFYPPDLAPTGRLLQNVAAELVRRGHSVQVVCSRGAYASPADREPRAAGDGVAVRRMVALPLRSPAILARAADNLLFMAEAGAVALSARADVVVAASSPPFVGAVAALAAAVRGRAQAQWAMDLYPDVLRAHAVGPWLAPALWALERVARAQFRAARLVLAPGRHVAARLARHLLDRATVCAVPLWSDVDRLATDVTAIGRFRAARGWAPDDLVLLYSGNMGRGHRLDEFLQAADRLGPRGPAWAFVGGGRRRSEVEAFRRGHPSARIALLDYVPAADLPLSLCAADVHLVSLRRSWSGAIVPSKLQAAFSAGRPVIFVGPRDSEVGDWIAESGGGWNVEEGDVDALLAAIESARDATQRRQRGRSALEYAHEHFARERNCGRIATLLEECASAFDRAR